VSVSSASYAPRVKRCKVCGERKPFEDFYRAAGMADGFRNDCKVCNLAARAAKYAADPKPYIERVKKWQQENSERLNEYRRGYRKRPDRKAADREGHLRRKYGITVADYERMLEEQNGGCRICGRQPPDGMSLHVDHDHESNKVRGLLCFQCNNAIGLFEEQYELFQKAANYLDRDEELAGLARERVKVLRV
jgi:hypothetical protein